MTWTIEMSNKELDRKSEIENVLEKRESQKEAALKLDISERHFRTILHRYRKEGLAAV